MLKYENHKIDVNVLEITMKDPCYPLKVILKYHVIEEYDLIEKNSEIISIGNESIRLEYVKSGAWYLPWNKEYRLTHLKGMWAHETRLVREGFKEGKKVTESRFGHISHYANLFFSNR